MRQVKVCDTDMLITILRHNVVFKSSLHGCISDGMDVQKHLKLEGEIYSKIIDHGMFIVIGIPNNYFQIEK